MVVNNNTLPSMSPTVLPNNYYIMHHFDDKESSKCKKSHVPEFCYWYDISLCLLNATPIVFHYLL